MKFTIRDLLWLTVVVALAVGWWADHFRQAEQIERLIDLTRPHGLQVPQLPSGGLPSHSAPAPILPGD
jgi:hypothetical protein